MNVLRNVSLYKHKVDFGGAHVEFCKHQVSGARAQAGGNYNLTETSDGELRTITPGILITHVM